MNIQTFTFNPFSTNGYVCHAAGEAVIVDAPSHEEREHEAVVRYVEEQGLAVRHLLLTHGHIDHVFGCTALAERFGVGWQAHREALPMLRRAAEQGAFFGVRAEAVPEPTGFLAAGDEISFGGCTWRVLYTPGHSPGSITFFDAEVRTAFTGDVLFQRSIGRTDLPGGSMPTLMASIYQQLLPLGDDVRVYPGHGPATMLGEERRLNPFLQETARG